MYLCLCGCMCVCACTCVVHVYMHHWEGGVYMWVHALILCMVGVGGDVGACFFGVCMSVCVYGCAKCYFVVPSILMCWILVCILPTVAALTSVLTQPCCVSPATMEQFTFSPQRIQRKTNSLRECKCHSCVCCSVAFRFSCMSGYCWMVMHVNNIHFCLLPWKDTDMWTEFHVSTTWATSAKLQLQATGLSSKSHVTDKCHSVSFLTNGRVSVWHAATLVPVTWDLLTWLGACNCELARVYMCVT